MNNTRITQDDFRKMMEFKANDIDLNINSLKDKYEEL